ncbi:hypothetical protein E3T55_03625 [Cryobacterium frigoriphilum]|uniref:Uncharacterized protein n=1 Tax=Cryobacterium frigoriphilum TaxID=1259150 RepID=A0A4R9A966_9MICO|nr:hypothetical protein [Cryobacterium frigoriphilum]TFD54523.1 hypothetical protein E3T55_03625 [Cryobacterium frigoriphilum]
MTTGRHSPARRGFRYALSARSMLLCAALLALTLCVVVVSSGGTYARLNSQVSAPVATIASGTATLTVSALTLPNVPLYPGLTVAAPVTVTNVGNVPLVLSVSALTPPTTSTPLSASLSVGVAVIGVVGSAPTCSATVTPAWTQTFATAARGGISPTLATGAAAILCVAVTLAASAPLNSQGHSASQFALVITGIQN